jgi:hypothetical protein
LRNPTAGVWLPYWFGFGSSRRAAAEWSPTPDSEPVIA